MTPQTEDKTMPTYTGHAFCTFSVTPYRHESRPYCTDRYLQSEINISFETEALKKANNRLKAYPGFLKQHNLLLDEEGILFNKSYIIHNLADAGATGLNAMTVLNMKHGFHGHDYNFNPISHAKHNTRWQNLVESFYDLFKIKHDRVAKLSPALLAQAAQAWKKIAGQDSDLNLEESYIESCTLLQNHDYSTAPVLAEYLKNAVDFVKIINTENEKPVDSYIIKLDAWHDQSHFIATPHADGSLDMIQIETNVSEVKNKFTL